MHLQCGPFLAILHYKVVVMARTEVGAADRWEVQLRKGCLELAILATLQEKKLYGLEILQRLESDSDLIVSEGTIYPLLGRLSGLGLLRSEWKESTVGPDRRYYVVTPAGIRRLREMTAIWEQFSSSMINLLQPCGKNRGR